jgi:hypothetical protein
MGNHRRTGNIGVPKQRVSQYAGERPTDLAIAQLREKEPSNSAVVGRLPEHLHKLFIGESDIDIL